MTTSTAINYLDQLFTRCGTASFVLSSKASFFSIEFKAYLEQSGISSNKCSIYHFSGNGQAKKTIQLALKTAGLPHEQLKIVLPEALYFIRYSAQPQCYTPRKILQFSGKIKGLTIIPELIDTS